MSYLVLSRKYRPNNFEEVVEQTHIVTTLQNSISNNRVAHAILFAGPRGTGKTTIARTLSKALNCREGTTPFPCGKCDSCLAIAKSDDLDVIEIDGASNNSVDQIREIKENIRYAPVKSPYKIYIIDEVHMLSISAFNALLKTLEEPPNYIKFFFATTESNKIPVTILSRCQRYDLKRISEDGIFNHIKKICDKESINIEEEALRLIVKKAEGSLRDSLSVLDQMLNLNEKDISSETILSTLGLINTKTIFDIADAVFTSDIVKILEIIEKIYYEGYSLNNFFKVFVEHIRNLIVVKTLDNKSIFFLNTSKENIAKMKESVTKVSKAHLEEMLDILFQEEANIKFSMQEKFALEFVFIKLSQVKKKTTVDDLIEKIDLLQKKINFNDDQDTYNDDAIKKDNDHITEEKTLKENLNQELFLKKQEAEEESQKQEIEEEKQENLNQELFPKKQEVEEESQKQEIEEDEQENLNQEIRAENEELKEDEQDQDIQAKKENLKEEYHKRLEKKIEADNNPLVKKVLNIFEGEII